MKKLIPHLIATGIFLVVTFIFFMPLFQGQIIAQSDIKMWEGMSKEIVDFRTKFNAEPLWTNSMFGGMPAYQISVLYPANLLSYVNTILTLGLIPPAAYVFLAMLCFYILLITLNVDFRIGIAGAFAYALVSFNFIIIQVGHNSQAHAIALMPLVIAGMLLVFNKKYLLGAAVTAIALGLEVYANHLQITYYLLLTILVMIVSDTIVFIKEKELKHIAYSGLILLAAVILGVMPSITSLLATNEYGKDSTRGASELTEKKVSTGLDLDYITDWSYGKWETATLLVPNAVGGASQMKLDESSALAKAFKENGVMGNPQAQSMLANAPIYWGAQDRGTSGPVYVGAIAVFLFVLGCFLLERKYKWWMIAATVLSIMLAWGKNLSWFTEFFFFYFPGYNKFRAVTMILVIASLTIPLLGFLGLQKLFDSKISVAEKLKSVKYAFFITAGLCILILAGGASQGYAGSVDEQLKETPWLLAAIRADRASVLQMDVFRSLFFVFASAALLWYSLKGKIKQNMVFIAIAVLVLFDSGMVAKRYLSLDDFQDKPAEAAAFTPSTADLQILADKELGYRVMNTAVSTFNDASTSYFHRSIGGYHGAKLKRYQELIEKQIATGNQVPINMLNTKYYIFQDKQTGQLQAQQNPDACGAAWFVTDYKMVANADSEITALTGLNPKTTAIIDKRFAEVINGMKINFDSSATIKLVEYLPNHLTYKSKAGSEQLAVFSEIYYDKGWNAYIDGKLTPHARCNYVLRTMPISAGEHTIEFKFEPAVYATGERISLISSILLLLACAAAFGLEIKKRMNEPEEVVPVTPNTSTTTASKPKHKK